MLMVAQNFTQLWHLSEARPRSGLWFRLIYLARSLNLCIEKKETSTQLQLSINIFA